MDTRKMALVIVGLLLLLAGVVFALQGAGIIGGSALMSGNASYIYVGAVVAIIGLILVSGAISKSKTARTPATPTTSQ